MEVATNFFTIIGIYNVFQHLFFLMEVATKGEILMNNNNEPFQHLFFLMEVATGIKNPWGFFQGKEKFQHLFFLMEVATINTCTFRFLSKGFQHLFFLMEVATAINP